MLLHSAAYFGKIKPVRALVEKFNSSCKIQDYRGQTPLHIAALSGHIDVCVYLIDKLKKKDIDAKDNSTMTALMNCILSNNEHAFVYLYFKGNCSLNHVDLNGNTLLHLAAEHNAVNIALILKHLYDIEVKEEVHNSSFEKIRKISQKSMELHQLGSPKHSP